MSNETLIKYRLRETTDHDKTVKIEKQKIACYSQEQMDEMYPEGGYKILGETLKKNKKKQIAILEAGKRELVVSKNKSHNRILYGVAGYLRVDEDEYIVLLESRLAFIILFFGGVGTLMVLVALIISMIQPDDPIVIDPDHPVPTVDPNVESMPSDDDEKPDVEEGGGSLSMIYTLEATLTLSTGKIDIYFKNPNASTHDVSIILYVINGEQEIPIAQSGLIKAGNGLSVLDFAEGSAQLRDGVYSGKYLLSCFDPLTGERALVQPEIAGVTITVVP